MMNNELLDIDDNRIFSYRYGRYLSSGFLVIGFTMAVAGIFIFISNITVDWFFALLGLVMFGIAILIYIPTELFQVNFRTKEYRVCVKFFNHYKGEWKSLNRVQYLSIIARKKTVSMSRPSLLGAQIGHNVEDCNLRFYIKAGYYIEIDDFDHKKEALQFGKLIADGLELKLLDATIRPPEFVD